ncbi:MAG: hypothetical protein MZV64_19305 [Ignavibacteriales bacterium]|nr:hypothetical protein [Ignavibacteriales bacterium]
MSPRKRATQAQPAGPKADFCLCHDPASLAFPAAICAGHGNPCPDRRCFRRRRGERQYRRLARCRTDPAHHSVHRSSCRACSCPSGRPSSSSWAGLTSRRKGCRPPLIGRRRIFLSWSRRSPFLLLTTPPRRR